MSSKNSTLASTPNSKFRSSLGSLIEDEENNLHKIAEENPLLPHTQNELHNSCLSNMTNKAHNAWNKSDVNQNYLIIEIDEKLFKDKWLSVSDAKEHRDNFISDNL